MTLTRRNLLTAAGALALASRVRAEARAVPPWLDHMLLGCNDLDQGIAFVEKQLGVKAAMGGVHPGRGSRNALLSFGNRQYLEIIAPDPAQPAANDQRGLHLIPAPRLIGWAAHVDDLEAVRQKLAAAKIAFNPVLDGQRKRPTGETLRWKALSLKDDKEGLLPFFIEWSKESPHPSTDAPPGCHLEQFQIAAAEEAPVRQLVDQLQLDAAVMNASKSALHARLSGPAGKLSL